MLVAPFLVDAVDGILLAAVVAREGALSRHLLRPRGRNGEVHVIVGFIHTVLEDKSNTSQHSQSSADLENTNYDDAYNGQMNDMLYDEITDGMISRLGGK